MDEVTVTAEIMPSEEAVLEHDPIATTSAAMETGENAETEVVQIIMEDGGAHNLELGAQLIQLDTGHGQLQQYLQVCSHMIRPASCYK